MYLELSDGDLPLLVNFDLVRTLQSPATDILDLQWVDGTAVRRVGDFAAITAALTKGLFFQGQTLRGSRPILLNAGQMKQIEELGQDGISVTWAGGTTEYYRASYQEVRRKIL